VRGWRVVNLLHGDEGMCSFLGRTLADAFQCSERGTCGYSIFHIPSRLEFPFFAD
jgi:hypothetical protein